MCFLLSQIWGAAATEGATIKVAWQVEESIQCKSLASLENHFVLGPRILSMQRQIPRVRSHHIGNPDRIELCVQKVARHGQEERHQEVLKTCFINADFCFLGAAVHFTVVEGCRSLTCESFVCSINGGLSNRGS